MDRAETDTSGDLTPDLTPGLSVRDEFAIFEHTTYANSCSQGALANRVRAAAEEWLAGWDENGAEWEFWVERNEAARAAFAGLLHAEPDDVAVTTSVSQGVSALVSALDLSGERNRIVISEYEFPTVGQIAHAQELRGAEVVHVRPEPDGRIPLERFADAVDERTALVCCTAVSFRSGHRHDVSAIAEVAHAQGALVLADSYQAIGAVEVDVRTLGADVVTGRHGQVPARLGRPRLHVASDPSSAPSSCRPRRAGSPTRTSSRCRSPTTRRTPPRDASTAERRRCRRSTPAWRGWSSSLRWASLRSRSTSARLVDLLLAGLDELGATVATPRAPAEHGPLICVVSTDPNALVDALAAERIVTSTRDSNLRISLHLYNVEEDVERILAALAANRRLLA